MGEDEMPETDVSRQTILLWDLVRAGLLIPADD